jgi:hypothetical protein
VHHSDFRLHVPKPVQVDLNSRAVQLEATTYDVHLVANAALGGVAFRLTSVCGGIVWIKQEALQSLMQCGKAQVVASRSPEPALRAILAEASNRK